MPHSLERGGGHPANSTPAFAFTYGRVYRVGHNRRRVQPSRALSAGGAVQPPGCASVAMVGSSAVGMVSS